MYGLKIIYHNWLNCLWVLKLGGNEENADLDEDKSTTSNRSVSILVKFLLFCLLLMTLLYCLVDTENS